MKLYKRFKSTYLAARLLLRSFEALKPFFVRKLKERYTCCCVYHVQMIYLKETFNQMRQNKFGHHGKDHACTCSIRCSDDSGHCIANESVCHSITNMWESLLCPKPHDSKYYARKCLFGDCFRCGINKLTLCPDEISVDSREVTVKIFTDVSTGQVDGGGSEKKRKDLVVQ